MTSQQGGTVSVNQAIAQERQQLLQQANADKAESMGFDCEFVEFPPEALQSECPICLQIIRDPHQVTCCGYSFCHPCIMRVKTDNKPCPTCNVKGFSEFPNKGLKRSLYAFKVRCSHKKDGCQWIGELGQLDLHLNNNPPPDKRLQGCPLTTINCEFLHVGCGEKPPRKDMQTHMGEYLHTHMSLIAVSHAKLAVENDTLKRMNVDLQQECHFQETNSHKLQDKLSTLEHKISVLSVSHTSLQESHAKLFASHDGQQALVKNLSSDVKSLKESHDSLVAYNLHLNQEVSSLSLNSNTKATAAPVGTTTARTKIPLEPSAARTKIPLEPSPILVIADFQQHKIASLHIFSPSVYTHYQGYKLFFKVWPNGYGAGEGNHVSICIFFMRGDFDDFLQWPFRGVITFRVLDQLRGVDHATFTIKYNETMESKYCSRSVHAERAPYGWGPHKFIPHSQLKQYVRNDTLQLQMYDGEIYV